MSEDRRNVTFTLEQVLKRSWPIIVAGIVVLLAVCILVIMTIVRGASHRPAAASGPETSTSTLPLISAPRRLDGVQVDASLSNLQPYAVMVENSPDARPLSGPAKANLVIEAPVEGGITRFMLVFDASTTVAEVGPVRSARPYYVELADALHAVYAHVGGSPDALTLISTLAGFRNLDEMANGSSFWRSSARSAPHNAFTKDTLLQAADERKLWESAPFTSWKYMLPEVTSTESATATAITIPYGGTFDVKWVYDPIANQYARRQAGLIQKDADGTVVTTTNVVVMMTDGQVLDDYGRLKVRTTGSGTAYLFRDGKRFELRWRRKAGEWISFEDIDGTDALFRPGKTWISIVTQVGMVPTVQ